MKERLDVLLVRRGLAESREKAKAVIMAGCVYVNDQKEDKAGAMFDESQNIKSRGKGQYLALCQQRRTEVSQGYEAVSIYRWKVKCAWILALLQEASRIVCFRMAQ